MTVKCPKCKTEYIKGNHVCLDCGSPLIKKEEKREIEYEAAGAEVIKLVSVSSHVEAGLLQGILEGRKIPSYSVDKESGGYMRVYMGYSIFGEDIYVRASDYQAAAACLEEWNSQKETDSSDQEPLTEEFTDGEWEQPEETYLEIEKEAKEFSGSRPFLFRDRRVAAFLFILLLIIGAITLLPNR